MQMRVTQIAWGGGADGVRQGRVLTCESKYRVRPDPELRNFQSLPYLHAQHGPEI